MNVDLRAAREKTVRDHMRLETELDFEAVLRTFVTPATNSTARARSWRATPR